MCDVNNSRRTEMDFGEELWQVRADWGGWNLWHNPGKEKSIYVKEEGWEGDGTDYRKGCVSLASSKSSLALDCQEGVWAWVEKQFCAYEEGHSGHILLNLKDHSKQEPTSKLSNQDGCFDAEGTCLLVRSLPKREQISFCINHWNQRVRTQWTLTRHNFEFWKLIMLIDW